MMQINNSKLLSIDEKWKLIYSEQTRAPLYAVGHYINHIKKQIDEKGHKVKSKKLKDGIHPLSYILRKLKLDLKISYESFVSDYVREPNNGLHLLVQLLKQLQLPNRKKSASVTNKESKLEEYKRQLADEHDCLLCIKFTLRCQMAVEQLVIDGDNLQTITASLMSSTIKSRVITLEILTLALSVETGFDRVFETFTYMRLKFGESVRFKILVSMLLTQGYGQIIFQVATMRFFNTLLAASGSGNLKVYLQQEIKMAGLDIDIIEKCARGDGLEFDDLKREIEEWMVRLIDVDTLLKKPKRDVWCKDERSRLSDHEQHNFLYGSRTLPPIPTANFSEIPPGSIQLLMNILHKTHLEQQAVDMQTLLEPEVIDPEDITSDYQTDQENYIAHVYKNTEDHVDNDVKRSPAAIFKHHVRENIYETLNARPSSLGSEDLVAPHGVIVHNRDNSTKRLGSLNGNWVLRTHLSLPSLNDASKSDDDPGGSRHRHDYHKPRVELFSKSLGGPNGTYSPESEPEPDYSPETTSCRLLTNTDDPAFLLLDEFDKMLDTHEDNPILKRLECIPSGTITYV